MELFLNLCWLALLAPAWLLWRQRICSARSERSPKNTLASTRAFFGALGCAFVLLFPVISATDDLHAMRPEMEESERAFRDAKCGATSTHAPAHVAQPALWGAAAAAPEFAQIGVVARFALSTHGVFSTPAAAGRGPPLARWISL